MILHIYGTLAVGIVAALMIFARRYNNSNPSAGRGIGGWAAVADMELIKTSVIQLVAITDVCKWNKVVLPRPGCGAGELSWAAVKQELDKILDYRFYSITF